MAMAEGPEPVSRSRGGRRGSDGQGEHRYLGELQAQIMEIAWTHGQVTVRDVLTELVEHRELAYTTVMTVMARLWEEGLLVREQAGKTYVYRAARTRDEFRAAISSSIVHDLVADFGDVALAQFVDALEQVDPSRLARLRSLVAGREPIEPDLTPRNGSAG